MTDDEINRRIADIEGWIESDTPDDPYWVNGMTGDIYDGAPIPNNPPPPFTTDWAWCGPLITKHVIAVWPPVPDAPDGAVWTACAEKATAIDEVPQRAICLAVMAAEEE